MWESQVLQQQKNEIYFKVKAFFCGTATCILYNEGGMDGLSVLYLSANKTTISL